MFSNSLKFYQIPCAGRLNESRAVEEIYSTVQNKTSSASKRSHLQFFQSVHGFQRNTNCFVRTEKKNLSTTKQSQNVEFQQNLSNGLGDGLMYSEAVHSLGKVKKQNGRLSLRN